MNQNPAQALKKASPIRRSYWVCQVSGWLGVFLLGTAGAYAFRIESTPAPSRVMSALALFCAAGLVVSHLLYLLMRSRHWLQMPVRKAWPRLAVAIALATAILSTTSILANIALLHTAPPQHLWRPRVFFVIWANHLVIMVSWMALYLAVNEVSSSPAGGGERPAA